ncbi:tyrosine-type recombinase/integrase [Chloroflexota bacterium]
MYKPGGSAKSQVPVNTSVRSLTKGFILTQRTDCKSPRTIEYYESNLRRFLWYADQQEWSDDVRLINEWHIREFLGYVSGEGNRWGLKGNGSESSRPKATYCTVHHYYCVLKAFFNWLVVVEGLAHNNSGKDLKPPRVTRKVVSTLSDEEIGAILNTFSISPSNARNRTLFMLLIDTGLRIGELFNLKMDDVHMDEGYLKVMGKGKKERIVPIGNNAQRAPQRYLFRFSPFWSRI